MKKIKRGQALIETIVVLSLYFFMIGFVISGFQLLFNKAVISLATYEYARVTIAYESAKKFSNDTTSWRMGNGSVDALGVTTESEKVAQSIIEKNVLALPLLHVTEYELYGLRSASVSGTESAQKLPFNPRQHMYVQAVIEGNMDYLFPIIDPGLTGIIAKNIKFSSSYVIAKERIWNDREFIAGDI